MKYLLMLFLSASAWAQTPKLITGYSEQAAGDFLATFDIKDPITAGGVPVVAVYFSYPNPQKTLEFVSGGTQLYCYRASSLVTDLGCYFYNAVGFNGAWQGPYRLGDPVVAPVVGPTMTWKPAQSAYYVDPADHTKGRLVLSLSRTPSAPTVIWGAGYFSSGQFDNLHRLVPACEPKEFSMGCHDTSGLR